MIIFTYQEAKWLIFKFAWLYLIFAIITVINLVISLIEKTFYCFIVTKNNVLTEFNCKELNLKDFFLPCIWFALLVFRKNILVHFVGAVSLTKLLMETTPTVKAQSCSFSNNKCYCLLGCLFSMFQEIWIVNRQI